MFRVSEIYIFILSVSGQKFAMLEMKVVLSVILLHYKLLPSEHVKELTLETGIVLQSLENFPVRITARNLAID